MLPTQNNDSEEENNIEDAFLTNGAPENDSNYLNTDEDDSDDVDHDSFDDVDEL